MKKTNIKKRIKRAMAAFLREELLEYIGYNHEIPLTSIPGRFNDFREIDFDTMVCEQLIPIEVDHMRMAGETAPFEELIQRAKEKMGRELLKHIHVDAQNLANDEKYYQRSVRFIIRVQRVKPI